MVAIYCFASTTDLSRFSIRTYFLSKGHQTLILQPIRSSASLSPSFVVHYRKKSNQTNIQETCWNTNIITWHGDTSYLKNKNTLLTTKAVEKFTLANPPILFLFSFLVDPMDGLRLLLLDLSVGFVLSGLCKRQKISRSLQH